MHYFLILNYGQSIKYFVKCLFFAFPVTNIFLKSLLWYLRSSRNHSEQLHRRCWTVIPKQRHPDKFLNKINIVKIRQLHVYWINFFTKSKFTFTSELLDSRCSNSAFKWLKISFTQKSKLLSSSNPYAVPKEWLQIKIGFSPDRRLTHLKRHMASWTTPCSVGVPVESA